MEVGPFTHWALLWWELYFGRNVFIVFRDKCEHYFTIFMYIVCTCVNQFMHLSYCFTTVILFCKFKIKLSATFAFFMLYPAKKICLNSYSRSTIPRCMKSCAFTVFLCPAMKLSGIMFYVLLSNMFCPQT